MGPAATSVAASVGGPRLWTAPDIHTAITPLRSCEIHVANSAVVGQVSDPGTCVHLRRYERARMAVWHYSMRRGCRADSLASGIEGPTVKGAADIAAIGNL